jgi:quercetin dioxygenase-like cupin family protein
MAQIGTEMINPVTKERFVWRQTAESTGGEYAEFDLHLGEGAAVDAHIHPRQREDFRIESGTLRLSVGGGESSLGPGDKHSVEAGTKHSWQNVGPGPAHVVLRFMPALRSEDFFDAYCGLASEGKANKKGVPRNLLQAAVLFHEFRDEIAPAPPASYLLGPLMPPLAWLGRRRGMQGQRLSRRP